MSKIYLLTSNKHIEEIKSAIKDDESEKVEIKILYNKERYETNKNLVVLDDWQHKKCVALFGAKNVVPYNLTARDLPKHKQETHSLYVPIPDGLYKPSQDEFDDDDQSIQCFTEKVVSKMRKLENAGLISKRTWKIIPIKDRKSLFDKYKCFFINFDKSVDIETIAFVRLMLDDTYWFNHGSERMAHVTLGGLKYKSRQYFKYRGCRTFNCFWAYKQ